jgi:hypothetical protein
MCQKVAGECSKVFRLSDDTIRRIAGNISRSSHFALDKASLKVLASSPVFFYRPVIKIRPKLRPLFRVSDYLDTVDEIKKEDLPIDEIAQLISQSEDIGSAMVASNV